MVLFDYYLLPVFSANILNPLLSYTILHFLSLFQSVNTSSMERINKAILLREILPEA